MEVCLPWEGSHAGGEEECEESYPPLQGAGETACDELTTAPTPSPCATDEEEVEEFGAKQAPEEECV